MLNTIFYLLVGKAQASGINVDLPAPSTPLNSNSIAPNSILPDIATQILHILTFLAYPIAFVGIIYSAYILVTASDKPESLAGAKKNIIYMVIGFLLILIAVSLVSWVAGIFNASK